jgi:8-oxo-dGTP pyrophosphatase MutT (NUDIX family)
MTLATPTLDEFTARARRHLRTDPPGPQDPRSDPKGDHALDRVNVLPPGEPKAAAVLVPVIAHPEETTVLLTQRATGLRAHSGQIAFPGGRLDEDDASPLAAALREAEEEIGLDARYVRPLGYLDAYLSGTGYLVTPVVGLVERGAPLSLNETEVFDTFEVPLGFLMDPARHEIHEREWNGRLRRYYAIPFGERYIWGVTAGIIRNLYERLYRT